MLANGWRQPGSAFKPINYVTGINQRTITASTMLMDVSTDFGGGYTPSDADGLSLERGPLRVRQALQFSLNIPAVKTLAINGIQQVFDSAKAFGLNFQNNDQPTAGLSMTLGTLEVHPIDLATAYATLANGGRSIGRTSILSVKDSSGKDLIPPYTPPDGTQVVGPGAASIVTDILAGNTDPNQNPYWGKWEVKAKGGQHRDATLKTGTNNDAKDLNAYGYIAPPTAAGRANGEYALVIGAWAGNSDGTPVSSPGKPALASLDVTAPLWSAVMTEVTKNWQLNNFKIPNGVVQATVDAHTGYKASQFSKDTFKELFIQGTQPGDDPYIKGVEVITGPTARTTAGTPAAPVRRSPRASSTSPTRIPTIRTGRLPTATGRTGRAGVPASRAVRTPGTRRRPPTSTNPATSRTARRGVRPSSRRARATRYHRHRPACPRARRPRRPTPCRQRRSPLRRRRSRRLRSQHRLPRSRPRRRRPRPRPRQSPRRNPHRRRRSRRRRHLRRRTRPGPPNLQPTVLRHPGPDPLLVGGCHILVRASRP